MQDKPAESLSIAERMVEGTDTLLTNGDLAKIIRKSPATVRWLSTTHPRRLPPHFKIGKTTLYPRSAVVEWIQAQMSPSIQPNISPPPPRRRGRPRKKPPAAPVTVGGEV